MISIIVCSKNKLLSPSFAANIAESIGLEYELIHVDNSEGQFDIFSAYNHGVNLSRYANLCFVHDDVHFHSQDWGQKILKHLQLPEVGICGVAGRDFVSKVPAAWNKKLSGINIIQSDKLGVKRTRRKLIPENYKSTLREVVTLDGVILCVRKELFQNIRFDEKIGGFHGYDLDFCIQSKINGYKNFVMYDIVLEHFSRGNPNADYYRSLIKVLKWKDVLPLYVEGTSKQTIKSNSLIEYRGLTTLLGKMVRRRMPTNEIRNEINYFTDNLNLKFAKFRKLYILPEIYLLKVLYFHLYFTKKEDDFLKNK